MPYTKIWVHLIFSTKDREPYIRKDIKAQLIEHIRENGKSKGIFIDFVNGGIEHLHLLISLGSTQTIATVAQLIKGESSHWVNQKKLCKTKFEWQEEYIALSVSDSQIDIVRNYIKNQEEHHRTKTFSEEYNAFLKHIGINPNSGSVAHSTS